MVTKIKAGWAKAKALGTHLLTDARKWTVAAVGFATVVVPMFFGANSAAFRDFQAVVAALTLIGLYKVPNSTTVTVTNG